MILSTATAFYLIGASVLAAPPREKDPFKGAIEVLRFSFENDEQREYDGDKDYDGEPDDWTRRKGPGFPQYVASRIDTRHGYKGRQSLMIQANGGQAAIYSPVNDKVGRIDPLHTYVFEVSFAPIG